MDMVKVVITAIPANNIAAIGNIAKKPSISSPFLNAPGRIHLALFIVSTDLTVVDCQTPYSPSSPL